jgi:hypothetical protein
VLSKYIGDSFQVDHPLFKLLYDAQAVQVSVVVHGEFAFTADDCGILGERNLTGCSRMSILKLC